MLDNIRSLYNVGSMFRTADAFGLDQLYLCGITGTPLDELRRTKIAKTSLGAETMVPWSYVERIDDLLPKLKADGLEVVALEQTPQAIPLASYQPIPSKVALVVGHEVFGVHSHVLSEIDQHLMIPMLGQKESLNVAVAFGIACAQLRA